MKISIISVFPEIQENFLRLSLIGRAVEKGLIEYQVLKFSDYCSPKERIDESIAGPGCGMVIKPDVVERAIEDCQKRWGKGYKVFFSPQGKKLTQRLFKKLSRDIFVGQQPQTQSKDLQPTNSLQQPHLILVCSRYEGVDTRVENHYADLVISIGDYVVMGGDLPAMVFLEGLLRLMPGIVGKWESVEEESFSGPFLDYPTYGLPVEWKEIKIPQIVQSGNHAAIKEWRRQQACRKTILNRFDWFTSSKLDEDDVALAQQYIPHHYVALMHTKVKLKEDIVGTTSITSLDLHDTARSCITYGVKNFFVVTPLKDQQEIIKTFLRFWQSEEGKRYNPTRYRAIERVRPTQSLDQAIETIKQVEGKDPILIATSAQDHKHIQKIDYSSQSKVWNQDRPILFIFGTGRGLADEIINRCDFLLIPVSGMSDYKHLSVRGAIAIILDRWLGLHPKIE